MKRPSKELQDGQEACLKRQKISNPTICLPTADISSGRQLRQILVFNQDLHKSRQGIQAFKLFLNALAAGGEDALNKTIILKEYLELQKLQDRDEDSANYLPDLMQTWRFASQSNNESLLSAVPAVLTLLLRILSSSLELSQYGLRLAKTLLVRKHQELIGFCLVTNKNKEYIISPALRLLRELAIFDGGVLSKNVFRGRDQTFRGLTRNLNLRYTGDGAEDTWRPSVRTTAVRFVLSLVKFLPMEAKRELLSQRDIVFALTREIKEDPPFLVREILDTIKANVIIDKLLPRDIKTKLVNPSLLGRIATLYHYKQSEEKSGTNKDSVIDAAHDFLLLACTSLKVGVLLSQSGLYPRGIEPDSTNSVDPDDTYIDLGLDSIEWMQKFTGRVPVRNTILSEFIQTLRPWSNHKQAKLLLSILEAAPELVADYFYGKKDFSFEPKLTMTWIGYSAFIFAAVQLPIPKYFGHQERYAHSPPPPSIIMEHLLPQPLSNKVLSRCLSQSQHSIIIFFAIRILCIAFQKLQRVLQMYQEASNGSLVKIWTQSALEVTRQFTERCPTISQVINAYRRLGRADLIQREAITRLLVLYYEVIPRSALEANCCVPAAMGEFLRYIGETNFTSEASVLHVLELENLFTFANSSPGIKWCSRGRGHPLSPFMAMLKFTASATPSHPMKRLRAVLISVVEENQILQTKTAVSALDSFVCGLRNLFKSVESSALVEFLEECISRCSMKPTKYIFMLEEMCARTRSFENSQSTVSLLSMVMLEQWRFQIKIAEVSTLLAIARFISQHIAVSIKIKENEQIVTELRRQFVEACPQGSEVRKILESSKDSADGHSPSYVYPATKSHKFDHNPAITPIRQRSWSNLIPEIENPAEDHKSLIKWTTKAVDEVIEDGHAASLVLLLSSNHLGIRKEALTNISKLSHKLKDSKFEEREQIWLLLAELNETARLIIDQEPLPSVLSAFASHAINVLKDPSHWLFPKINKFLSRGPIWQLGKIPLIHKILDEAPSLEEISQSERKWLLTCLNDGLRSKLDMATYRKQMVFEKLLSYYSANLGRGLEVQILRILIRATMIDEGSTTLITRFSIMTWVQIQESLSDGQVLKDLKDLAQRLLESCDQKRIGRWSENLIK